MSGQRLEKLKKGLLGFVVAVTFFSDTINKTDYQKQSEKAQILVIIFSPTIKMQRGGRLQLRSLCPHSLLIVLKSLKV